MRFEGELHDPGSLLFAPHLVNPSDELAKPQGFLRENSLHGLKIKPPASRTRLRREETLNARILSGGAIGKGSVFHGENAFVEYSKDGMAHFACNPGNAEHTGVILERKSDS